MNTRKDWQKILQDNDRLKDGWGIVADMYQTLEVLANSAGEKIGKKTDLSKPVSIAALLISIVSIILQLI